MFTAADLWPVGGQGIGLIADKAQELPKTLRIHGTDQPIPSGTPLCHGLCNLRTEGGKVKGGVRWGGPESLIIPAKAAMDLAGQTNSFRRFRVSGRSIRFAAGLEEPGVLVADVLNAIKDATQK